MTIKTAIEMREAAAWELDRDISCHAPNTDGKRELLIEYRDRIRALPVASPPPAVVDVYPDAATREQRRAEMREAEATVGPAPDDSTRNLPCGHDHSLGVRNIESNVVFCELCEARDERRDALTMEQDLARELAIAVEALRAIQIYGSDTLSGRVDGPDDRAWQRQSVVEMTKRASRALAAIEGTET